MRGCTCQVCKHGNKGLGSEGRIIISFISRGAGCALREGRLHHMGKGYLYQNDGVVYVNMYGVKGRTNLSTLQSKIERVNCISICC